MLALVVGLAFLGIASFFIALKGSARFYDFVHLLLFAAIAGLFCVDGTGSAMSVSLILTGTVALNFVAAQIMLLRKDYVRILLPLISAIVFFTLFNGELIDALGQQAAIVNKFFVVASVLAVVGFELGRAKIFVLKRFFGDMDETAMMKSLLLFFMGVAVFFAMFQSGAMGVLAIAAFFMSSSFYRDKDAKEISLSLLMLAVLPVLMHVADASEANLMSGEVLEGVFFGAFGSYFLSKLWLAKNRSTLMIVLGYLLVVVLCMGLLYLDTSFAKMGGMDAFVGVMVGMAITNAIVGGGIAASSLFPILLAGGLILPNYMVNEAEDAFDISSDLMMSDLSDEEPVDETEATPSDTLTSAADTSDIEPEVVEQKEIFDDYIGKYSFVEDSSRVVFTLGEDGETKGAFKKVSGTANIAKDFAKSTVNVTMAMENFTTFNTYRDKSLMSDEYFSADQFPKMTYKVNKLEKVGDTWYFSGQFTMLGVSKTQRVTVRPVTKGGRKFLVGKGKIDRTQFGMTPSETEGNIVSFDYQVELK